MAFAEDLTVFFDTADFADVAVITPADGSASFEIKGIMDAAYLLAGAKDVQIDTDKPRFLCASADAARAKREDAATILGKTYDVLTVEPDGTGLSWVVMTQ